MMGRYLIYTWERVQDHGLSGQDAHELGVHDELAPCLLVVLRPVLFHINTHS